MLPSWNFEEVIRRLRETGFNPSEWPRTLAFLSETIGSTGAILFGTDRKISHAPSSPDLKLAMNEYFQDEWYERDSRRNGARLMARNGIVTDQEIAPEQTRHSDFYRDCLSRHKCEWFSGLGFMAGDDLWCLAMQRGSDKGAFQSSEVEDLKTLWRPFSDAATLTRILADGHSLATIDALELVEHAALVCDADGVVLKLNETAQSLVGPMMSPKTEGLTFLHAESASRFSRLLAEAAKDAITSSTSPLAVDVQDNHGRGLVVRAISLKNHSDYVFTPASILLLVKRKPMDRRVWLESVYKLTPTEVRIAEALCSGLSLEEIADAHGVKRDSIRTQLKFIYNKTDVHTQRQLVLLLTSGPQG